MDDQSKNTDFKQTFLVSEADSEDIEKGLARLHEEDMQAMDIKPTDIIEIIGNKKAVAKVMPITDKYAEPRTIQIDGITRENAGAGLEDFVEVKRTNATACEVLLISPVDTGQQIPEEEEAQQLAALLSGIPIMGGNKLDIAIFGFGRQAFQVLGTSPSTAVIINPNTQIKIKPPEVADQRAARVSYEDIGGLEHELARVREILEYPMKYPHLFQKLGLEAPKGALLVGPAGTGKTLIARAVANEVKAHFIHVNGPEIMQKFYGESEAKLRQVFAEAGANAPSIIFFDEIDAIAPKRSESLGNVEKRVTAQLLVLMDGLESRGKVMVIGASNAPNLLEPALRRPGRFDREIFINPPNTAGRLEVLRIHSRKLKLANDVDLDKIAERTHGFVGADLEAVCKEAGMEALRRILTDLRKKGMDPNQLVPDMDVSVHQRDFMAALKETGPSALREFLPEKSKIKMNDVGGLDMIKDELMPIVQFSLGSETQEEDAESSGNIPGGFFFSGPSGTGKTLLAKAIAGEFELPIINVFSSNLMSKWTGESEKALTEYFQKAKQVAPCILLLDEVDSIAPIRRTGVGEDSGVTQRLVNQLLREIDQARAFKELIIIATTNRLDLVDPALIRAGRFDFVIHFEKPNRTELKIIYKMHTKDMQIEEDLINKLSELSEGLVGSDVETICRKARFEAIQRSNPGSLDYRNIKNVSVVLEDFVEIINKLKEEAGIKTKSC